MPLSAFITKLKLDTEYIAFEYIGSEDEIKEIVFDTKENEKRFYEDFTEYIRSELDEITDIKIHEAFEDFIEENILKYDGYVKIECEEDMVVCWAKCHWCKVYSL